MIYLPYSLCTRMRFFFVVFIDASVSDKFKISLDESYARDKAHVCSSSSRIPSTSYKAPVTTRTTPNRGDEDNVIPQTCRPSYISMSLSIS